MGRARLIAEVLELQGVLARRTLGQQADLLEDAHLTVAQLRTMLVVHASAPIPTAEAARRVGLRPNVATGVVARLVDRGWIRRESDPADGRVRLLALTAEGEAFVARVVSAVEREQESQLRRLDAAQLEQLRGILEALASDA